MYTWIMTSWRESVDQYEYDLLNFCIIVFVCWCLLIINMYLLTRNALCTLDTQIRRFLLAFWLIWICGFFSLDSFLYSLFVLRTDRKNCCYLKCALDFIFKLFRCTKWFVHDVLSIGGLHNMSMAWHGKFIIVVPRSIDRI